MEKQAEINISFKKDGEITVKITQAAGASSNESGEAAGNIIYTDDTEMTEDEAERYAVASDLANVCDYLEDSEVIKIKLIIQKANARKERAENKE